MARCLIDVVDDIRSRNALASLETDLPKGLHEMYKRLLENIDWEERKQRPTGIVQRILLWLVGAPRPLHILELYYDWI